MERRHSSEFSLTLWRNQKEEHSFIWLALSLESCRKLYWFHWGCRIITKALARTYNGYLSILQMTSASLRMFNRIWESQGKKEVLGICTAPWQPGAGRSGSCEQEAGTWWARAGKGWRIEGDNPAWELPSKLGALEKAWKRPEGTRPWPMATRCHFFLGFDVNGSKPTF